MGRYEERVWPGDPAGATRAERTPCRFRAYVADTLVGADLELRASVAADLADIEQQVRHLNDAHPGLANLEPLARFLLRAEAVASSNIDGLVVNVRRLARSEETEREGLPVTDTTARAVLGNVRALDEALTLAADPARPVSVDDITAIHKALLAATREEAWAGIVRREQNWIGGANPCSAAFVPPPAEFVPELLTDLAAYLSGDEHPALLQAALAHSQFETIHPFADGNGRTGRALIQLVLRRRGVATRVVPPISLVLATQADRYVDALDETRIDGSPMAGQLAWVELFLSATGRACRDASQFVTDLVSLERSWRERLGRVRANSATDLLLTALPSLPVFSITTAAIHIGRTFQATSDAVNRLADSGVVRQVSLGRRNRRFEAVGLFEAFTGFERVLASPDSDTQVSPPTRPVPQRPAQQP
ncbi:Fic family protein [Phytoactinopolyspora halotolerans]|uniref:Fic family protein n=1 Tax=Phytoactinopolyspora halotolerans TaxID=1981512 RepID=UPI001C2087C6|nr:Fic family protein [Phytoactinopolyspora halotolerans]